MTLQMLVSCPGDVPIEDRELVFRTVNNWNFQYGRQFGLTVVPLHWAEHAVSTYGGRPQEMLNDQLVRDADLVLAIFADRLGSPTGVAESGTAEEILVAASGGKHVSILRSTMPRPTTGMAVAREKIRLEEALERWQETALVMPYASHEQLVRHVHNLLSSQAISFQTEVRRQAQTAEVPSGDADPSKSIWPRIEVTEHPKTDSKGRLKTEKKSVLVLDNQTGAVAHNVTFKFQNKDGEETQFALFADEDPVDLLPPGQAARFPLFFSLASEAQALCKVSWQSSTGEFMEQIATVRRY